MLAYLIPKDGVRLDLRQTQAINRSELNSDGRIACVFHKGKNPNLQVSERGFHCYKCQVNGIVVDGSEYERLKRKNEEFLSKPNQAISVNAPEPVSFQKKKTETDYGRILREHIYCDENNTPVYVKGRINPAT